MANDLTNSQHDRQNILNNRYAIEKIEEHLGLGGFNYQDTVVFTKQQLAALFEINDVTIERYITNHGEELRNNGYTILKGQALKEFLNTTGGVLINEGSKITVLGIFTFRAVLNIAMLLTESDRARMIRSRILDIVIEVIAERSGGHTRYINQRDIGYLPSAYQEFSYRQVFTNALDSYLDMGKAKYGIYTNKIYQLVFQENAQEYRQIFKISDMKTWKIKLLYDGACPLCVREVNFLKRKDGDRGLIKFVDIVADDYEPAENADINFATAMGRIHAVLPNGEIIQNVEVFRQTYDILGIGWIYAITKLPLVGSLADALYGVWADYRLLLTGRANLQTIVAERRQRLQGCTDGCAIAEQETS